MICKKSPSIPCPSCPWRKSAPAGGSAIPNFNLDLMRGLSNTVGPDDAFRPVIACHYSEPGEEFSCVGYVAVEGWSNLNVRLMMMRKTIDMNAISEACEGIEMWASFREMLEAYEVAVGASECEGEE